jgi:quinoprotein glucose dehydrogenase
VLLVSSILVSVASAAPSPDIGWSAYGGRRRGHSVLTLGADHTGECAGLRVAWTFRTGELGQGVKDWSRSAFEATPILYDGTLYLTTSSTDVVAVNAVTGKLRWRHDSKSRDDLHYSDGVSRGVSLWVDAATPRSAVCHARIYAPTLDGRLLALDAASGKPCLDFGERGAVNLLKDVRSQFKDGDEWQITS